MAFSYSVVKDGDRFVEVKCLNRGSIKRATVNLKCYSPEQFQVIDLLYLRNRLKAFLPEIVMHYTTVAHFPFLKGLNAHYHVMNEDNYNEVVKGL